MAQDVSAGDFEREVLDRSREVPVVVDFWAPWCGPCRTLGPVLDRVAAEAAGRWILVKVNTDENQALAQTYGIQGIPAVKAFRDGKVVAEFVGAQPEAAVRTFVTGMLPDPGVEAASRARSLAAKGDVAGAEAAFRQALAVDPVQADALIFGAQRAMSRGDRAGAAGLMARVRDADRRPHATALARLAFAVVAPSLADARAAVLATPEEPSARFGLAQALAAAGDHAEALEILLALVRRHRAWGNDAARVAMLQVFDAMGERSAVESEYRRRLSMELYT